MANAKILERKQDTIDEISSKVKEYDLVVLAEYQKLSVSDMTILRRALKETEADIKIYKNTLVKRAMDSLNYDFKGELEGPKVMVFGKDPIIPLKILSKFAKEHPALILKAGIVDKNVVYTDILNQLANTPSRDELLTMFASGLIEHLRNFAIALDLHSKNLEN